MAPTPSSVATSHFKPWVQTISTSLVYRFNWSGPVVAEVLISSLWNSKAPASCRGFFVGLWMTGPV